MTQVCEMFDGPKQRTKSRACLIIRYNSCTQAKRSEAVHVFTQVEGRNLSICSAFLPIESHTVARAGCGEDPGQGYDVVCKGSRILSIGPSLDNDLSANTLVEYCSHGVHIKRASSFSACRERIFGIVWRARLGRWYGMYLVLTQNQRNQVHRAGDLEPILLPTSEKQGPFLKIYCRKNSLEFAQGIWMIFQAPKSNSQDSQ